MGGSEAKFIDLGSNKNLKVFEGFSPSNCSFDSNYSYGNKGENFIRINTKTLLEEVVYNAVWGY